MATDDNPYRSPRVTQVESGAAAGDTAAGRFAELGRVMVTWEKLRVLYNLMGAVPTLLIAFWLPVSLKRLLLVALFANMCFCLGPLVDGYLTWFGIRHPAVTWILFVLGTLTMLLLALGYVGSLVLTGW